MRDRDNPWDWLNDFYKQQMKSGPMYRMVKWDGKGDSGDSCDGCDDDGGNCSVCDWIDAIPKDQVKRLGKQCDDIANDWLYYEHIRD